MGTYPELPSYILETGENLQDVINKYPNELFGEKVLKDFRHMDLPFLPKVNFKIIEGDTLLTFSGSIHRQSSSTSSTSGTFLSLRFRKTLVLTYTHRTNL